MVSMAQQQTTREMEIGKFIIHRCWRRYVACLKGPQRKFKRECRQREKQDLGHLPYLRCVQGMVLEVNGDC